MKFDGQDGLRQRVLTVERRESGFLCRLDGQTTWWGPFQEQKDALLYASRKLGRSKSWPIKWIARKEDA